MFYWKSSSISTLVSANGIFYYDIVKIMPKSIILNDYLVIFIMPFIYYRLICTELLFIILRNQLG